MLDFPFFSQNQSIWKNTQQLNCLRNKKKISYNLYDWSVKHLTCLFLAVSNDYTRKKVGKLRQNNNIALSLTISCQGFAFNKENIIIIFWEAKKNAPCYRLHVEIYLKGKMIFLSVNFYLVDVFFRICFKYYWLFIFIQRQI